jgi:uncharacterized membrane protein
MKDLYNLLIIYILLIMADGVYFMFVKNLFDIQIRAVQGTSINVNLLAFFLCYIFIAIVIYYFIIRENNSIFNAFLLGLCIYAIYELTNKALFNKWKWSTVILDSLWGGILFMLVAKIYKIITK